MGQPQIKAIERQQTLATEDLLVSDRAYNSKPILEWPWQDIWNIRTVGTTLILRNRLRVPSGSKAGACGAVPMVVKISADKGGRSRSLNADREGTVGRVIRKLVAREILVNTVVPLFSTGSNFSDSKQQNIAAVLSGPGKRLPSAIEQAIQRAKIGANGSVTVSLAPAANCPKKVAPPSPKMERMEKELAAFLPGYKSCASLFDLLAATEKACSAGMSNETCTYIAVVMKSILAQLALAYATINQAGVQHLDGHFNNQLVSFTGAFDILAQLSTTEQVVVPVRGVFVQVFDWDWSVKWAVPVNDSVLNTASLTNSSRVLPLKNRHYTGFVFDHASCVSNADYGRFVLLLAGQFPKLFALCHRYGVAGAAFGQSAATAAKSPAMSLSFRPNKGSAPYQHGFLVIGEVTDSTPCTPGHRIKGALEGLRSLASHALKGEPDPPADASVSVTLPYALSRDQGEQTLQDAPGLLPCPLFPFQSTTGAGAGAGPAPAARVLTPPPPSPPKQKKRPREDADREDEEGAVKRLRRVVQGASGWLRRKVYG